MIQPIGQIKDVPEELIRQLNERFRQITPGSKGTKATAGGRPTRIRDFPAAKQSPGDFYVEMDRGNALYQIQAGKWLLVSGFMAGPLVKRPSDLSASDTGFLYRSTDTHQEFRWSGTAWVDQTKPPTPTTQSVVTGSRALATNYQNTTDKPIWVSVCAAVNATQPMAALVDAASPPTTVVATFSNGAAGPVFATLFFCVLPTYYYRVNVGAGALTTWLEWS